MTFADKIKKLRKDIKWTQKELAEYLDVSQAVTSHWEHGLHIANKGRLQKLIKLCQRQNLRINFTEYLYE